MALYWGRKSKDEETDDMLFCVGVLGINNLYYTICQYSEANDGTSNRVKIE